MAGVVGLGAVLGGCFMGMVGAVFCAGGLYYAANQSREPTARVYARRAGEIAYNSAVRGKEAAEKLIR